MTSAIIYTVLLMGLQDAFGTALVVSEARNLWLWPGSFDAAGDFVNRAGTAITAGAYVRYGLWNWHTLTLLAAAMATSFTVTNTATPLASALLPKQRRKRRPGRHGLGHLLERIEQLEAHTGLTEAAVATSAVEIPQRKSHNP